MIPILPKRLAVVPLFCLSLNTAVGAQQLPPRFFPSVSPPAQPQDLSKAVVPITSLMLSGPGVEASFGTGYCLDLECRFVSTNYHVAAIAQPRKVGGEKIIRRYFATGPDDENATVNAGPSIAPLKYTLIRDLALFELRHPLAHHHGLSIGLAELEIGQSIDIYSYPKESISPVRSLLQFHGVSLDTPPRAGSPSSTARLRIRQFVRAQAAESL